MVQGVKNKSDRSSIVPDWWGIIKVLREPFILLGSDGTILRVNQSALTKLNYSVKELKHISILDLVHGDDKVKEVNNYIDITYSNKTVSTSIIRLKTSGGSFIKAEQILHLFNDPKKNRKLILLTFRILNENGYHGKWEDAESIIKTINGLTNMFDMEEFASSYNKSVVDRIKKKLYEFSNLITKSKVA
jgi:PAS domain-containing protein